MMAGAGNFPLKGRFNKLDSKRSGHLQRQIRCSELTIPALLPKSGTDENKQLPTPYQSLGARGVNTLAAKLLLILMPPNTAFAKLKPDPKVEAEMSQLSDNAKTKLNQSLGLLEQRISGFSESNAHRVPLFRALKLLIVTGNALVHIPEDGPMRVLRLDKFVVVRDGRGNVIEIIVKENVSPLLLPKKTYDMVKEQRDASHTGQMNDPYNDPMAEDVEVYTWVRRTRTRWEVHQECLGELIPGTRGTYPLDACPWLALRWADVDGEHYGRGLVEDMLGDLLTAEGLTQAVVEAAAAAAKVLFLINPGGTTNWKDLANTANCGFVPGREQDVYVLQVNKVADLKTAGEVLATTSDAIAKSFLMNSSVQRHAERVTAEEIRFMAQELESTLGGVYSLLSQEFQLPLVKRIMLILKKRGEMPDLGDDVRPVIVTGMEALGRGHDLDKLRQLLMTLEPLGPEAVAAYLIIGDYIDRCATALGIDTQGLIRSEADVEQQKQLSMLNDFLQKAGPGVLQKMTDQLGGAAQGAMNGGNAG